jgi:hypothetical protein
LRGESPFEETRTSGYHHHHHHHQHQHQHHIRSATVSRSTVIQSRLTDRFDYEHAFVKSKACVAISRLLRIRKATHESQSFRNGVADILSTTLASSIGVKQTHLTINGQI